MLCYLQVVTEPKAPKPAKSGGFIIRPATEQKREARSPGREPTKERAATEPTEPDRRQVNNPLHGLTLEVIVTRLVEHYGFEELGELIQLNCFRINPSIRSSLKYLRLTPRARARVEELYLATFPTS